LRGTSAPVSHQQSNQAQQWQLPTSCMNTRLGIHDLLPCAAGRRSIHRLGGRLLASAHVSSSIVGETRSSWARTRIGRDPAQYQFGATTVRVSSPDRVIELRFEQSLNGTPAESVVHNAAHAHTGANGIRVIEASKASVRKSSVRVPGAEGAPLGSARRTFRRCA